MVLSPRTRRMAHPRTSPGRVYIKGVLIIVNKDGRKVSVWKINGGLGPAQPMLNLKQPSDFEYLNFEIGDSLQC